MSRIDDVLQADATAQSSPNGEVKRPLSDKEVGKINSADNRASMTLLDFIGWTPDQEDNNTKEDLKEEPTYKDIDAKMKCKPANIVTNKRFSYLENLGMCRSPTARH